MSSAGASESHDNWNALPMRGAGADLLSNVLALNRAHEVELSPLTEGELASLVERSFYARALCAGHAFMIAFDHEADHASANFAWFRERYATFVYVDRLAVAESARMRGLARRLYMDLLDAARVGGFDMIACEVNVDPPNPQSDALHASLGFREVGRTNLASGKTVRYLILDF